MSQLYKGAYDVYFWKDEDIWGSPATKLMVIRVSGLITSANFTLDLNLEERMGLQTVSFNETIIGEGSESAHKTFDVTNIIVVGENRVVLQYAPFFGLYIPIARAGVCTAYVSVEYQLYAETTEEANKILTGDVRQTAEASKTKEEAGVGFTWPWDAQAPVLNRVVGGLGLLVGVGLGGYLVLKLVTPDPLKSITKLMHLQAVKKLGAKA